MTQEEICERIVAIVNEMRENTRERYMFRNIPLAKEGFCLVKQLESSEETPMGRAMACNAIYEELSEHNVPRFALELLRYELAQLELSDEEKKEGPLSKDFVRYEIQRLEDFIDIEHVSMDEFMEKYHRHLKFSSVERTPIWEEIYYDVEVECDKELGDIPRGMGFCYGYWHTLQNVLAKRGIEWQSPKELNPRVMFD
ncbi:MAG: hypothetical protein K5860_08940 [Bacteroidales bacterium]|jgi:hypothetical protein|nr:hypothetical protein [Bacteroidales bacterium]